MNFKTILSLVTALIVVIVLISSTIIPIVQEAQTKTTEVTLYNDNNIDTPERGHYWDTDFEIVMDSIDASVMTDAKLYVNGEQYAPERTSWNAHTFLKADNFRFVWQTGASSSNMGTFEIYDDETHTYVTQAIKFGSEATITYTAASKDLVISYIPVGSSNLTEYSKSCEWIWSVDNTGDYIYANNPTIISSAYVSKDTISNNLIGILNTYDSSFTISDTTYLYTIITDHDGTKVYSNTYTGEMSATLDYVGGDLVDGYSNIYKGGVLQYTLTVEDLDDPITVNVYRSFILDEVEGNYTSTNDSIMLGIIPMLVLIIPIWLIIRAFSGRD